LILEKVPLFLLSAASCAVTYYAQQKGGAIYTASVLPMALRISNAMLSAGKYAWETVWPSGLSGFYPHPAGVGTGDLPVLQVAMAGLFLALSTAAALRWWRRFPYLPVGWFWFLGTLIPVLGFVQAGEQAMADRYTYIPLTGLFVAAVWGVSELSGRWPAGYRTAGAAGAAALIALSISAGSQTKYWENSVALFRRALEVSPRNAFMETNLGFALYRERRLPEAIEHFRIAVRMNPNYGRARMNLAVSLEEAGYKEEAAFHYGELLRGKRSP
jgi:tetratricopeptide (TPR) repeat protein